ncbi:hypothetical protein EVAR_81407_1 [Eumeta japonica]|uniref:Uncharacterized protein n=1 Tax=Eumeta variegata TaxID=151549 RepID=A0A4C1WI28_EUMVA|nr:hypothetical protein EVAR_81407_1 [Eumeta japonica]
MGQSGRLNVVAPQFKVKRLPENVRHSDGIPFNRTTNFNKIGIDSGTGIRIRRERKLGAEPEPESRVGLKSKSKAGPRFE